LREYKHRITTVFVFPNKMVAVCDQNGQQMPFFQGRKDEVMPRIKRRLDRQKGKVVWHGVENLRVGCKETQKP